MSANAPAYTQGSGTASLAQFSPLLRSVDPTATDVLGPSGPLKVGQQWVNQVSGAVFYLVSLDTQGGVLSATWSQLSTGSAGSVDTLTGDSGGAISPVLGNINLQGTLPIQFSGAGNTLTATSTTSLYPITPYVVGPVGVAPYQTIQSAIDAAVLAGGNATVYIQAGTYTENLTLASTVDLAGAVASYPQRTPASCAVIIIGVHTPPAAGSLGIRNVCLQSAGHAISSVAVGTAILSLQNVVSNVSGYLINLPGWVSPGSIFLDAVSSQGTDGVAIVDTANLTISNSINIGALGGPLTTSGLLVIESSDLYTPVLITGSASVFSQSTYFGRAVTISGNAAGQFSNCSFDGGATPALTFNSVGGSGVSVINCSVISSALLAIDGTGTSGLKLTGVEFPSSSEIAATITPLSWGTSKTGSISVQGSQTGKVTAVDFAASPYAVVDADFYLACDTTAGVVTVDLPATPVRGRNVVVADSVGLAGTNNIVVNGNGNNITAGGVSAASKSISDAFSSLNLVFSGSHWENQESSVRFPITPYVVGPVGEAPYQTIQSAIDAAVLAGAPQTVYIQPGTYTENLSLANGISLLGSGSGDLLGLVPFTEIIGIHTPPTGVGDFLKLEGLLLRNPAGSIISSAAVADGTFAFFDIISACNGYFLDLPNWSAANMWFNQCRSVSGGFGSDDGFVNAPSVFVYATNCDFIGFGSVNPMIVGSLQSNSVVINPPVELRTSFSLTKQTAFAGGLLIGGDAFAHIYEGYFVSGASPALTITSTNVGTSLVTNSVINTSNNPAISLGGANQLKLTGIEFVDGSVIAGTLANLSWGTSQTGDQEVALNLSLTGDASKVLISSVSAADSSAGSAVLVGGTVTVNTTSVTASSLIFLTHQVVGGVVGVLSKGTVTPGTSFVINSSSGADTSTVAWWIVN